MKKFRLFLVLVLLLFVPCAMADNSQRVPAVFSAADNVFMHVPGGVTSTDTSVKLTTAIDAAMVAAGEDAISDFSNVRSITVTCEDYPVRIAFGRAASTSGTRTGFKLSVGESAYWPSASYVQNAYIISGTVGSAGHLQISLGY